MFKNYLAIFLATAGSSLTFGPYIDVSYAGSGAKVLQTTMPDGARIEDVLGILAERMNKNPERLKLVEGTSMLDPNQILAEQPCSFNVIVLYDILPKKQTLVGQNLLIYGFSNTTDTWRWLIQAKFLGKDVPRVPFESINQLVEHLEADSLGDDIPWTTSLGPGFLTFRKPNGATIKFGGAIKSGVGLSKAPEKFNMILNEAIGARNSVSSSELIDILCNLMQRIEGTSPETILLAEPEVWTNGHYEGIIAPLLGNMCKYIIIFVHIITRLFSELIGV